MWVHIVVPFELLLRSCEALLVGFFGRLAPLQQPVALCLVHPVLLMMHFALPWLLRPLDSQCPCIILRRNLRKDNTVKCSRELVREKFYVSLAY